MIKMPLRVPGELSCGIFGVVKVAQMEPLIRPVDHETWIMLQDDKRVVGFLEQEWYYGRSGRITDCYHRVSKTHELHALLGGSIPVKTSWGTEKL